MLSQGTWGIFNSNVVGSSNASDAIASRGEEASAGLNRSMVQRDVILAVNVNFGSGSKTMKKLTVQDGRNHV